MILSIRPGFMSKHPVHLHKALDSEGFQTISPINTLKFLIMSELGTPSMHGRSQRGADFPGTQSVDAGVRGLLESRGCDSPPRFLLAGRAT